MKPTFSTLINPEVYTHTSLREDVLVAANHNLPLSYELIANIVIKYIYAYFYFDWDEIIPLEKIEKLVAEVVKEAPRSIDIEEMKRMKGDKWDKAIDVRFHLERLTCEMLFDVPATVEIFHDIAMRILDPSIYWKKYIWIDLGSGSGILTLAQYIQAERNQFKEKINLGIELGSYSSKFSNTIINTCLWVGKIIRWDTTSPRAYGFLSENDAITFITNETIPDEGAKLDYSNKSGDPFVANCRTLEWVPQVTKQTQFFPQKFKVWIPFLKTVITADHQPLLAGNPKTTWGIIKTILQFAMYWKIPVVDGMDFFIYQLLINGQFRELSTIGSEVIDKNIACKHPDIRPRWR